MSRVYRTKHEAKTYYNHLSSYYDMLSGGMEYKLNREALERLNPIGNEDFLEIGFGTGKIIKELILKSNYLGKIYGVDLSERMIEKTLSRLTEEQKKRVFLQCGDAVTLPYSDGQFDKVFISFTLELFDTPEIPLVLRECQRILKPSGKIVIVSMSKRVENPMVKLYEWFHKKLPRQVDCRPIYTRELLENVGFSISEEIHRSLFGLPVDIVIAEKNLMG